MISKPVKLSKIVFLDIEASGLGDRCYPIEIGFVRAADLFGWSVLIRPTTRWRKDGRWQAKAEELHGISQAEIEAKGSSVVDVARALNKHLAGMAVFSDAPDFDGHWVEMLFEEAMEQPCFEVLHVASLLSNGREMVVIDSSPVPMVSTDAEWTYRQPHRAREDAFGLATAFWARLVAHDDGAEPK